LPSIEAIPDQIQQLFQNLISNALKFSRQGIAPHVHIAGERVAAPSFTGAAASEGDYCRIRITDNGIGFNEMYLGKIFTMFQRLHSREEYEGNGIGLTIVKKII